ncbi:MAG: DMT family transporter [Saccharospirillaceae bacterium]|nr:DMT family transporter [Saccharospirillaceae bacterium]MCD8530114.1 DMT family transporter [Saccharospirillaceae bacterium]
MSFMLVSALAWSLLDLARKKLTAYAQPLTLAIWLSAGVTPLYLLLWLFQGASLPDAGYWLPGLVSLLVSALASVCYIRALSVGRIALLIPVLAFTPVVAALLSVGLLGERLSGVQWLAMLSIVLAIFLLHSGWNILLRPKEAGAGLGLMLVVALCLGTGIVFDTMALTSATVFFHGLIQSAGMCLVLLLAYSADSLRRSGRLSVPNYSGPWGLLVLALLVFILAVSGQWLALDDVHPGIVETVKRSIGIIGAACWGVWIFGETVKPWQGLLMLLIIVATAGLALY